MAPKKPVHIEAVSKPSQDYRLVVREIAIGVVLIISAWGTYKGNQAVSAVKEVKATVSQVQETMTEVKHQTDGNLTAAKLAIAISAESLAKSTGDVKDAEVAKQAWDAYRAQASTQEEAAQRR